MRVTRFACWTDVRVTSLTITVMVLLRMNVEGVARIDCPSGFYGSDCKTVCSANCVNGECSQDTGQCTGGCTTGFLGDNCTTECPAGDSCAVPCPKNCINNTCDPQTGACSSGCRGGFWGSDCSLALTLEGKGYVETGETVYLKCSSTEGSRMPDDDIDWFKDGVKIDQEKFPHTVITKHRKKEQHSLISELFIERGKITDSGTYICRDSLGQITSLKVTVLLAVARIDCPSGFYGSDCTTVCSANCVNGECSQDTGQCKGGCTTGFLGDNCTTECPAGFYGDSCAVPCPKNCINNTCDPQTGACSSGCQGGFWGSDCSLALTLEGKGYVESGETVYLKCSSTEGSRMPDDDIDWFKDGVKIDQEKFPHIVITKYHKKEQRALISELFIETGKITDSGTYICRDSLQQIDSLKVTVLLAVARIDCPSGFYGSDCTTVCSANCVNGECSQDTGQCTGGCTTGFLGDNCTTECPAGFYGDSCAVPCPKNCINNACDPQSGACSSGCQGGFWGSDCSLECPAGFYGDSCAVPCPKNCINNTCDPQTGACSSGCQDGFWGSDCSLALTLEGKGYVESGETVYLKCSSTEGSRMHDDDDIDWFKDGVKIDQEKFPHIVITKYRKKEQRALISELFIERSKITDSGTYICRDSLRQVTSLKVHVLRTVTRTVCPSGFYGSDCTTVCSANCVNGECSQDTGQCTGGCTTGFLGDNCTTECPAGFYGDSCAVPCPKNCINNTCDPQTSACSSGCQDGFWGSDCSLGVELSRNSPEEKRSFYSHLSAEGKSILLYLLASRYEHALARAQFEIEQAVQGRNELQQMLRG